MSKSNEYANLQAELDKIKRVNTNCEDRIKTLFDDLTQMTTRYNETNTKYESIKLEMDNMNSENKELAQQAKDSQEHAQLLDSKYSGVDIKYKNLSEQYDVIKKDYDKTIQAMEEINLSRNQLYDVSSTHNLFLHLYFILLYFGFSVNSL